MIHGTMPVDAVRTAEKRLAKMQELTASALKNQDPSKLIRLNMGKKATKKERDVLNLQWLLHIQKCLQ